ncbi:MAG: Asp-tRNA(Asn)/Glu-tRNA(Gln) amidotransferase subunit GatC [Parachlamydiales bacterium]|jgi:aspartyl-tRNA(Asn)/glutamyl-tRNA(Gln) amidotransferase subunit C
MQHFDSKTLSNLEDLSKLKLSKEEELEFVKKLNKVLDFIEQLKEIDTENVDACNYVLMDMQKNVFREDEINNSLKRDAFLSNSPDHIAGMIKVPEVLTQKD